MQRKLQEARKGWAEGLQGAQNSSEDQGERRAEAMGAWRGQEASQDSWQGLGEGHGQLKKPKLLAEVIKEKTIGKLLEKQCGNR